MTTKASKTRTLYAQTPDGVTHTRKTDNVYTHAIAGIYPGKGWVVFHYCGSLVLAQKQLNKSKNTTAQIIPVTETKPEPTHFETVRAAFLTAPAVEVVKPSLSFPEPVPGKSFKTHKEGHTFRLIMFVDGKAKNSFFHKKEHLARQSVKRLLGLGYALADDGAKLVSPVSQYKGS